MAYELLFSRSDIQVLSATLVLDTERCTIQTSPTGIILDYQIPQTSFVADQGAALLGDLATAIEELVASGGAIGGYGVQLVDPGSNLLVDAVSFTVAYTPPTPGALQLTTSVVVPVDIITADPGFSQFLSGGSALSRLQAAQASLQKLAGG